MAKQLSLATLFNELNELKSTIGHDVAYLSELFSDSSVLPVDITTDEDSPGLWPSNGVNMYSIVPSMNMTEMLCTEGMMIHFAASRFCFQFMYVINDVADSDKNGKIYVRTGSQDSNSWNDWELLNTSKNTFQSLAYKGYMRRKSREVVVDIDPKNNYTEIALAIAGYYSSDAKRESVNRVYSIDQVLEDLNDKVVEHTGNLLDIDEGDMLVYGRSYIAVYDGAGGCFGSSIVPGEVLHYDNCLDIGNLELTKVIKL